MKKYAFTIYGFILCFLLVFPVMGQNVQITMEIPRNVNAGQDFEVKLTINKGTLSDYSRFSQELPLGLTATNVNSPNADFSFEEQRVRIIWLKLPEGNTIDVVYKIHVERRLKGSFTLDGNFAYVVNEERKYASIESSGEIFIVPDPTMNQASLIDIKDYPGVMMGTVGPDLSETFAMVIRQKPVQLSNGSVFIQLLIKNPQGSKYAKLEETIPAGYIFEEVESNNGIVSFGASQVKYIWMKLPEDPEFVVSYRLVPRSGERQEAMKVTGMFSYTINEKSYEDPVVEMNVKFADLTDSQKHDLLMTGKLPGGAKPVITGTEGTTTTSQQTTTEGAGESVASSGAGMIQGTKVLTPESGVYYRLQLIAVRMPFDASLHFSRLGIKQEIRVEQVGGLYKYTAGSFSSYVEASSYKKDVISRPGFEDAFIVAYRNGSRISIEDAFR